MLNLESLESLEYRPFLQKALEKPGIVRDFPIRSVNVMLKSGITKCIVHMPFSLTLCIVFRKVVVSCIVGKCGLNHIA